MVVLKMVLKLIIFFDFNDIFGNLRNEKIIYKLLLGGRKKKGYKS